MPSFAFTVQGNGSLAGWTMFNGATAAYLCIDDSTGTTHDSDATFIDLPGLSGLNPAQGKISFPFLRMAQIRRPTSIVLNVAHKRTGLGVRELQVGFYRAGAKGFHATLLQPAGSYVVSSLTFATDPITGSAWTEAGMVGLEACIESTVNSEGNSRITLLSGTMNYDIESNWRPPEPVMRIY